MRIAQFREPAVRPAHAFQEICLCSGSGGRRRVVWEGAERTGRERRSAMLLLKACPRCRRGDLIVEREEYGLVVDCLQCGYVGDLSTVPSQRRARSVVRILLDRDKVEAA